MNYSVINAEKQVVNIIEWDGETEWQPPEGCSVRLYEKDDHIIPQTMEEIPSISILLDKLSKVQSLADIRNAAAQTKDGQPVANEGVKK